MAITTEYIGMHFDANFLAWMRAHLIPEYADSIEVTEDGTKYQLMRDGYLIAQVSSGNWQVFAGPDSTQGQSVSTGPLSPTYGYVSQKAVAIYYRGQGNMSKNSQGLILFTHDNQGTPLMLVTKLLSDSSSSSTTFTLAETTHVARFRPAENNRITTMQYKHNAGAVTALCPFVVGNDEGAILYTPDVFWCPVYQYTTAGVLVMDGARYLSFGPWMVKDE